MKFIIALVVIAFATVKVISAGSDVGTNVIATHNIAVENAIEEATK